MLKSGAAVVLLLAAVSHGSLLIPPYIKPCARSDPNFNECALEHAKETFPQFVKGDRKFKITRLDPLEITEMSVSDGPSQSGFSLTIMDMKMHGLKDAVIRKTEFDFDKQHIMYDTDVPLLTILGKYEIKGRILVLPVAGKGDINITLINNRLVFSYDFTIKERDGVRYHATKNAKAVVEPSGARYKLTNLFNGDRLLGNQMNDFLNENWKEVYKSMSPALFEGFAQVVANIINNTADVLPFDALFPETIP